MPTGCLREPLTGPEGIGTSSASDDTNNGASHDAGSDGADSAGAATEAPTTVTGGQQEPGGCGDGVVDSDELCDDGNDLPDDGCDALCQPAPQLLWTRTHAGPAHQDDGWADVAIGPDGRIVVVGYESDDVISSKMQLSMFTSTGELLWERVLEGEEFTLNGLSSVRMAPDGTIFASGSRGVGSFSVFGVLLAFTTDGEPLWAFEQAAQVDRSSWIDVIDFKDGVLVSAGSDRDDISDGMGGEDQFIIVRQHDPATGNELWKQTPMTVQPRAEPGGIAIAAGQVVVAGTTWTSLDQGRFLAAYDLAGTLLWSDEAAPESLTGWSDVRPIGDGDFVVAGVAPGDGNDFRMVLQRLGPEGEERWTYTSELGLDILTSGVAVGPGGEIAVAASAFPEEHWHAQTLRFTSEGTLLWTSDDEGTEALGMWGWGVAIGAGVIAVVGSEDTADIWDSNARLRVFTQ